MSAAAKKEVVKEKKLFKGNDTVLEKVKPGVPVQFTETVIPANKFEKPLPNVAMITNIGDAYGYDGKAAIAYKTPKGDVGNRILPKTLKVRELTGTIGKGMIGKFQQEIFDNLITNLGFPWMVGSDPEIFVEDDKGMIIPAFNFLGSKEKPNLSETTTSNHNHNHVYWDGFQAEFNTYAATCLAWQVDSVYVGLKAVLKYAREYNPKARLSAKTVFEVPGDLLKNSKDEHVNFGCMPSLNAYGMEGKKVPARELATRSAGGHIHLGIGPRDADKMNDIVKTLDAVLGVSCVSLFAEFDDPARRQYYGLPGEYRTPTHGLEYRTISNAWTFHPMIMNIVFDLARKACRLGDQLGLKHFDGSETETIETIITCDVERARKIMDRNKALIMKLIKAAGGGYRDNPEAVFGIFRNGMESAVKDPTDIEGNWNLTSGRWVFHSDGTGKNLFHSIRSIEAGKKV